MKKIRLVVIVMVLILAVALIVMRRAAENLPVVAQDPQTGLCVDQDSYELYPRAPADYPVKVTMKANHQDFRPGDHLILTITVTNQGNTPVAVPEIKVDWRSLVFSTSWIGSPGLDPCPENVPLNDAPLPSGQSLEKEFRFEISRSWIGSKSIGVQYRTPGGWITNEERLNLDIRAK